MSINNYSNESFFLRLSGITYTLWDNRIPLKAILRSLVCKYVRGYNTCLKRFEISKEQIVEVKVVIK